MSINTTYPIFNPSIYESVAIQGPQGIQGPTGPQGEQGPPGAATGLSTGAFIYPGKVSMDSTGSLASPAITFSINPDVGYCYLRSGIATSIDGTERFHVDPSGAQILNGGFGIGTGPSSSDSMVVYRNTVANNTVRITNATGGSTIALESTGSASNWVSFAKLGQFAQSVGIDTLGNLCFSTSTSAPTTGSNAVYINQSKVLNSPQIVVGTLTGTTGNYTGGVALNRATIGRTTIDTNYRCYINGNETTGGFNTLRLENTGGAYNRVQLISNDISQLNYVQFGNGLNGGIIGMATGSEICISPSTTPAGLTTGSSGLYVDQSNNTYISKLYSNGVKQHSNFATGSGNYVSGVSPLSITGSPKSLSYALTRNGRVVSLDLRLVEFACSVAGSIVEIDIYALLNANGWTINSMPYANPTGVVKYLSPMTITRNAGGNELSTAVYFTGMTDVFSSMRIRISAGADFSGALNSIGGNACLSWIARGDSL